MSDKKAARSKTELIQLSRTVSHALRHSPDEYGIKLDDSGWVDMQALLEALEEHSNRWKGLDATDLISMAAAGEKQRYEIDGARIRAIYGHSTDKPIQYEEVVPPPLLFHGTTEAFSMLILEQGLKSMNRQYVHLSADLETATQVALRRTTKPTILKIDAERAHGDGVRFYRGNENVWLAKSVDKQYISK